MAELDEARRHADPVQRRRALDAIASAEGSPDLKAQLLELLADDDAGVRRATVVLIGRTGAIPGVLEALHEAIRDERLAPRSAAVDAYGKLGAAGVPALEELLKDKEVGRRRLAVDALGLTHAREAAAPLVEAFDDESAAVRGAAVEAICRVDPDAAPGHIRTLIRRKEEGASVLLAALLCLERLGARLDGDELRPHLKDPMTAVPAYRLLGRSGVAAPLVDAIRSQRGSRLRAALAGFAEAFRADRSAAVRALTSRAVDPAPLEELLPNLDVAAAEGALLVGALLGQTSFFAGVARREDRGRLAPALHEAALRLRRSDPQAELKALAAAEEDSAVAELLDEVAEAVAQENARAKPAPPPRVKHPRLAAADFDRLAALMQERAGLAFDATAAYRLESRLLPRLEETRAASFEAYVDLLHQDDNRGRTELARALERVTVHETYFFRELPQLEAFSEHVIPLLEEEAKRGPVRVWSAGCSTGEETWTLAILLEERGHFDPGRVELLGTDIAADVIETARRARYGRRGFRGNMEGAIRARYFERVGEEHEVKAELQRRVRFAPLNLLDEEGMEGLGRFDVIFCRNVMIYFSRPARERLVQAFYERLKPGGLLFLGHSESLLNLDTGFRFAPAGRELVYVRPSDEAPGRLGDHLLAGGAR